MKDSLAQQIASFIAEPHGDEATFNMLACALYERQYKLCEPYQRLCESSSITRWQEIPAVPAAAFKVFDLSCAPLSEMVAVFHSSGTTGAQSSRHYFDADALALYETSLRHGFDRNFPSRPLVLWAMTSPPADALHSSLSHMLGTLGASRFFWDNDTVLAEALASLREPITLFGTAFAFVQLFDSTAQNWRLPAGSIVIETGGFKGRTREVPREALYAMFQTRLGVPEELCFSEYGMSEMASQFYGRGLNPVKRGPHWVRSQAVDPATGSAVPAGESGLLRHYDLANWNSVMAIQTLDSGTLTPDGFVLHGRTEEADVRGCSLTVEELWTRK